MDSKATTAIQQFTQQVSAQFPIEQILLFGSYAREQTHSESDIDLAVLMNEPQGDFMELKMRMDDIAFDILLETGLRIQPLPIWIKEWQHPEQHSNPYLIKNIRREGIAL